MQSTFWKAVALTGVISVGCLVVYEVHRRMPKQPGESPSPGEFTKFDQNGPDSPTGENGTVVPPDESLPPSQDEPENGGTSGFDGVTAGDPSSAAPWEQIPRRADEQTVARAGDFLDVMELPSNSNANGAAARQAPPDSSLSWADGTGSDASRGTFDPIAESDQPPDAADPVKRTGWAGDEPLSRGSAGPENAAADRPAPTFGADGVREREAPIRTREIRPVAATEFPIDSATADPFGGGAPLEQMDTASDAAGEESNPIGLFDSTPSGPALDQNALAANRATEANLNGAGVNPADNQLPHAGEPDPLPTLAAAPLADEPLPGPGEVNSTFDPFSGNGTLTLPPDGSTEPADATVADAPREAEHTGPGANGQPNVREFGPFDAADSSPSATGGGVNGRSGTILPLDAPAEFPVGSAEAQPETHPAGDDTPPFTITPARERKPDPVTASPPAALPRRDFVGDGIISAESPSGPQQPELKIEKVAPPEATVGEPLVYAIRVTNVGRSAAHDVIVEDRIPRGTTLDGTIPRAEMSDKKLLWRLGTIEPGGEQMIRIRVVPTEAGEIGSVATVRFVAEVAAATVITRPELSLDMSAPGEVAVGEQATFHFKVVNSGAADARDIIIRSLLPKGLEHPDGSDIEYPLGRLRAGESREIELTVLAKEAGQLRSQGLVAIGSRTYAEQETPILVIPSRLIIRREGPARRFVGRKADYSTTVTNRSSHDLQQVTIEEQLPPGLELAAMPQDGQFDARRRTITWKLPLIRAGESIPLKTSVVPQSPGTLECVVRATDASGNKAALASRLEVAGFSALAVDFDNAGRPGPVGIGEQVSFRLTVKNRGTAAAEGVQALFEIPDHMEFVHADGPVAYTQEGQVIRFATLNEIPAKDETSFNIVLTAAEAGTKKVTAELSTPTLSEPLRNDQAVVVESDE